MSAGFRLSSTGNDKLRANRDKICEALAYESPIETMIAEASNSFDDGVFRAVLSTGIKVDKEELIKALKYDRGQYDKGYAVGVKEFAKFIIDKAPDEEIHVMDIPDYVMEFTRAERRRHK